MAKTTEGALKKPKPTSIKMTPGNSLLLKLLLFFLFWFCSLSFIFFNVHHLNSFCHYNNKIKNVNKKSPLNKSQVGLYLCSVILFQSILSNALLVGERFFQKSSIYFHVLLLPLLTSKSSNRSLKRSLTFFFLSITFEKKVNKFICIIE